MFFLNRETICENENTVLKCDQGAINVIYANYGRTSLVICRRPPYNNLRCLSDQSRHVSDLCNGQSECYVSADNEQFGDPCPGTTKYLEIHFTCESNIINDGQVVFN